MARDPQETQERLLEAAGELFAEHGLDGASLREITRKARANIATVSYHFGSKQGLYTATLLHAIETHTVNARASVLIPGKQDRFSRQEVSDLLHRTITARFSAQFSSDKPKWCSRLVMRALLDPNPSLQEVVKRAFRPDHEALVRVFRLMDPAVTRRQAELWAFSVTAQSAFYVFARVPILMLLKKDTYDPAFIRDAAAQASELIVRGLGLPAPRPAAPNNRTGESEDKAVL